jgi:NADH-quinone oxidoreductase subunit L
MGVGCAALAGVPFLSGFFSKDEILHAAMYHNGLVGWLMMITAGLTAYYTFRMFFLCFHGPLRVPKEAGDHPHESPAVMLRPLYLLAFGAVLAGYVGMTIYPSVSESIFGFLKPHGPFHEYLHESTMRMAEHHSGGMWVAYTSILIALGGIGLAYVQYGQAPQEDSNKRVLGPLWTVLNRKYWMDEIFGNVFVKPLRLLSHACFGADRGLVDGTVNVVGYLPRGVGFFMQFFHRGALQGYALTMILGLAVLVILWKYFESPAAEGVATAMGGN